jgi:hypothetical protein
MPPTSPKAAWEFGAGSHWYPSGHDRGCVVLPPHGPPGIDVYNAVAVAFDVLVETDISYVAISGCAAALNITADAMTATIMIVAIAIQNGIFFFMRL